MEDHIKMDFGYHGTTVFGPFSGDSIRDQTSSPPKVGPKSQRLVTSQQNCENGIPENEKGLGFLWVSLRNPKTTGTQITGLYHQFISVFP